MSAVLALMVYIIKRTRPDEAVARMSQSSDAGSRVEHSFVLDRSKQSTTKPADRLQQLEILGCVPSNSDWSDYVLAEKTGWWGKRLDPGLFWSNRVIWLDGSAVSEAWRHGRSYPPMPYVDPSLADRSDKDELSEGYDIQGGPNFHTVASEREAAFWDKFVKTHPHPPEDITRWHLSQAESWLRTKHLLEHDARYAARLRIKPERLHHLLETKLREADILGYPPECLTPEAIQWTYVMQQRQKYASVLANNQDANNIVVSNFFRRLYVDPKYVTSPLTAQDINGANEWKITYLRRLREESTDESYIDAYLKEWNLDPKDVWRTQAATNTNS